jgi:NADPH:quinone reductase-like Zn-dependent oxidoreductase
MHERYGGPDVLELRDVDVPEPGDDEVLVRVRAAALNRLDWYGLNGTPYGRIAMGIRRPREGTVGVDFAGTVEAVGPGVSDFRSGDEVFGCRNGALAEYVCAGEALALKPSSLGYEAAAALPVAALTGLQALRDKGGLRTGQRVLVNGASGGVGTFTVQIAKALGGQVTAVCGPSGVEIARSLGADEVVDYSREDFTRSGRRHDLLVDIAGDRPWRHLRRALAPQATLVIVGGPMKPALGPLGHIAATKVRALPASQKAVFFVARPNRADLETLAELADAGKLEPVVDRTYPLEQAAEALRHLGTGHPRGKVVVSVSR